MVNKRKVKQRVTKKKQYVESHERLGIRSSQVCKIFRRISRSQVTLANNTPRVKTKRIKRKGKRRAHLHRRRELRVGCMLILLVGLVYHNFDSEKDLAPTETTKRNKKK
jgi:hypothetical protein